MPRSAALYNECIIVPADITTYNNSAFDEFFLIELFTKAKEKGIEAYRRVNRRTELKLRTIQDRLENKETYIKLPFESTYTL